MIHFENKTCFSNSKYDEYLVSDCDESENAAFIKMIREHCQSKYCDRLDELENG